MYNDSLILWKREEESENTDHIINLWLNENIFAEIRENNVICIHVW